MSMRDQKLADMEEGVREKFDKPNGNYSLFSELMELTVISN